MSDDTPKQATPHTELVQQIMDSRVPKNEREWAAAREIEELRRERDEIKDDLASRERVLTMYQDEAGELTAKVAELEARVRKQDEDLQRFKNKAAYQALSMMEDDQRKRAEAAEAQVKRLIELLRETHTTMNHAEVFIGSREKMHPDGQALYRENLEAIDAAFEGER